MERRIAGVKLPLSSMFQIVAVQIAVVVLPISRVM